MSGGEPSSIKRFSRCAAGLPVPSRGCDVAYGATPTFGCMTLPDGLFFILRKEPSYASGIIP